MANPEAFKMTSALFFISYQSSRILIKTTFVLPLDGKTHFRISLREKQTSAMADGESESERYR